MTPQRRHGDRRQRTRRQSPEVVDGLPIPNFLRREPLPWPFPVIADGVRCGWCGEPFQPGVIDAHAKSCPNRRP